MTVEAASRRLLTSELAGLAGARAGDDSAAVEYGRSGRGAAPPHDKVRLEEPSSGRSLRALGALICGRQMLREHIPYGVVTGNLDRSAELL